MEKFCTEELNAKRIWLDVFEHNKRGLHVYQKLGYSKFKEKQYEGKNLLFYEKSIESKSKDRAKTLYPSE